MTFTDEWYRLIEELEELPDDTVVNPPLTNKKFEITDVQEHRIIVKFVETDETRPLQRDRFETLYQKVDSDGNEDKGSFDLDKLPVDAEPYAGVLALHPDYTIDRDSNKLVESDVEARHPELEQREVPELDVYSDCLLLIDALERYNVDELEEVETSDLVNLYTLLSDVQRGTNDFRKQVSELILDRVEDDKPVHGQYGSVQRTHRTMKELKDENEVLEVLKNKGVPEEKVTGIVEDKVREALDVVDIPEDRVYETEKREYVRKFEVDEDVKESRLQGLKDQLEAFESEEAEELRDEVEELESRIEELTGFKSGGEYV